MKIISFKMSILILTIFSLLSCRTESLTDDSQTLNTAIYQKDSTGTYKMKDVPIFKNYLIEQFKKEKITDLNTNKILEDNSIVEVINRNNKISYSTLVKNKDSIYQYYVFTQKNEKKQLLILELLSTDQIEDILLSNFTGTIIYKKIDNKIIGSQQFIKGLPTEEFNKGRCGSVIVTYACREGLHLPGETCSLSGNDRPYYEVTDIPCGNGSDPGGHGEYINPELGGGGGVGSYGLILDNSLHLNGFIPLSELQLAFLSQNNASHIAQYLNALFSSNKNAEFANFINWSVNFFMQNRDQYGNLTVSWEQYKNWFITDIKNGFLEQIVKENPATILDYVSLNSPDFKMSKLDIIKYPKF